MTCKQCGTDEDRINGFCSIECRDKFDYEEEIRELRAELKKNSNKSLKILLGEYIEEQGRAAKVIEYFKEFVLAWNIVDQQVMSMAEMIKELYEIAAGDHSEDCRLTIEQFQAQTPKP